VCCSVLQYVTMCCSMSQCVADRQHTHGRRASKSTSPKPLCVAVCCDVLQCVATCCSVLQTASTYEGRIHSIYVCEAPLCCEMLQMLHCVAVCCSMLQFLAVSGSAYIYVCIYPLAEYGST